MTRFRLPLIGLVSVLAIALAYPTLRGQTKAPATPAVRIDNDIVYGRGGGTELKLDLAMPAEGEGPFPGIVCIHGGGWKMGSRKDLSKTTEALARRGYVAVSVGYRLAPAAHFPAQIEDCKAAVRWLRANAARYRLNPDRIGAVGFSAGAHLACLLGLTHKQDGLEGSGGNADQSSAVQAVVSYFGPTDFTVRTWSDDLEKEVLVPVVGASYAEHPEFYKRFSPAAYVTRDPPPFLFFHGTEDRLVNVRHSRTLAKKLRDNGGDARVIEIEGEGHGWGGPKLTRTIAQTVQFFDDKLKK